MSHRDVGLTRPSRVALCIYICEPPVRTVSQLLTSYLQHFSAAAAEEASNWQQTGFVRHSLAIY